MQQANLSNTASTPQNTPLWHGELRKLTALAIPVVLSEIGWMAMTIVDTIMVGRLGPEAIGAVALGNAPTSPVVIAALAARADTASALVRDHVSWALGRHAVAG